MAATNPATGVAALAPATAEAGVGRDFAPRIRARWRSSTPHPFHDFVRLQAF